MVAFRLGVEVSVGGLFVYSMLWDLDVFSRFEPNGDDHPGRTALLGPDKPEEAGGGGGAVGVFLMVNRLFWEFISASAN